MLITTNTSIRTVLHLSKCLVSRSQIQVRRSKSKYSTAEEWIQPEGYNTGITVYNSLTKRDDELILPKGKQLSWYVCGPTVYDTSHVGHASCYMRFDIIRRILQNFFDINVVYMMGVTDVDDKIIRRADSQEQEFDLLAKHYEYEFFREMQALNISSPTLTARVTDNIPEIIKFIQGIIDKGHAYHAEDNAVYFDIENYGKYNRFIPPTVVRSPEFKTAKKNPVDFTLWKQAKPGEPYWDSPWGGGRPGWHIECSAMASDVFGMDIDIHSGGTDLMFPHHENEFAQSCSFHGTKQWANYWLHSGILKTPYYEEKMSKSLKNTIPVSDILEQYTPNQFRLFCMGHHYNNNLEYSYDEMAKVMVHEHVIQDFLGKCEAYVKGQLRGRDIQEPEYHEQLEKCRAEVMRHLRNNFNSTGVMNSLNSFMHQIGKAFVENTDSTEPVHRSPGSIMAASVFVKSVLRKLGFQKAGLAAEVGSNDTKLKDIIEDTVQYRWKVREFAKNVELPLPENYTAKEKKKARHAIFNELFDCSDNFRSQMARHGVVMDDRENVATWKYGDSISIAKAKEQRRESKLLRDNAKQQKKKSRTKDHQQDNESKTDPSDIASPESASKTSDSDPDSKQPK